MELSFKRIQENKKLFLKMPNMFFNKFCHSKITTCMVLLLNIYNLWQGKITMYIGITETKYKCILQMNGHLVEWQ